MNNKNRFFFGLVSSLLLAAGFVRAAERLDPLTQARRYDPVQLIASNSCGYGNPECWISEDTHSADDHR